MQSRKLVLYGDLAKYFGKEHTIYVHNVEEAIKYLAVNFSKDFTKAFNAGYYYVRKVGKTVKRCLNENELKFSLGNCDLHIIPVVKGAAMNQKSKGWVKVGVGTLLAVVGAFTYQGWAVSMGVSIALSGIVDVLTYVPPKKKVGDNSNNTAFSPQNVAEEGTTIPVIYGKVKVGSVVVSTSTYAERNYSALSERSVLSMLQRVINAINNEISYSLLLCLSTTSEDVDELRRRGNYYYYPGRYPHIYNELDICLARFISLEQQMKETLDSLKTNYNARVADAALNQTLTVCSECLSTLRSCYATVGEVCDIDVEYTPTYVKKRGWAKVLRIIDKPASLFPTVASSMSKLLSSTSISKRLMEHLTVNALGGGYLASMHLWYSQRINTLYRQSYTEDLYARTLTGSRSRRSTSTFTPLDSCFFSISVLQYYLENYTLFGL